MIDYHEEYKKLKKSMGYTNKDVAKMSGNTVDSIRNVTQPNKELPRWLKFAINLHLDMLENGRIVYRDE